MGEVYAVIAPVVIDQDDFEFVECLGEDAVEAFREVGTGVVNGDDQRNFHHIKHFSCGRCAV